MSATGAECAEVFVCAGEFVCHILFLSPEKRTGKKLVRGQRSETNRMSLASCAIPACRLESRTALQKKAIEVGHL